jgi:SAM-dependent methyltransferase
MAQNIYDDPQFFAAYSQFRRSLQGLDGAAEWPALRAMLPPMRGLRVADLGCGFGWFSRWAREAGAASVLGIDVSEKMLARARAETSDDAVCYERGDLDALGLPEAAFDLVHSALALHYAEDLGRLFETVHRAIVPGGALVFSIEHPIYMAPSDPHWITLEDGRKIWPLDDYSREGRRTTDWLAKGVVKYHRTLGTTLNLMIRAGLKVAHVEEWAPSREQIAAMPEAAEALDRPIFLLVAASR